MYCLCMLFTFNIGTFGSVKVERGEGCGSVVPYSLFAEANKLTSNLGERIGKLVEQYVQAMEKISGSLFEL